MPEIPATSFIATLHASMAPHHGPIIITELPNSLFSSAEDGWLSVAGDRRAHAEGALAFWFGCHPTNPLRYEVRAFRPGLPRHGHRLDVSRNGYLGLYSAEGDGPYWSLHNGEQKVAIDAVGDWEKLLLCAPDGTPVGNYATDYGGYLNAEAGERLVFTLHVTALGVGTP